MTFTEDVKCLVQDFISLEVSPTRFSSKEVKRSLRFNFVM